MAEYLSPGVYVEEFDSDAKPIEGVSTSTAGFIGMAEKGPAEGLPELVTDFEDFKRIYGGYLSAHEYGKYRFLSYAVEQFFINGGTRAFIMRVASADGFCAKGAVPAALPVLSLTAKNPGPWGNRIRAVIAPSSKAKTQICEVQETAAGKAYLVKNGAGFYPGDVIAYSDGTQTSYNRVVKCQDNIMVLETELEGDVVDQQLLPKKIISTCEFSMKIQYEDLAESYDHLSFNMDAPNYIEKKMAKSDLVTVSYVGTRTEKPVPPFAEMAEGEMEAVSVDFTEGSNGNAINMTAADFIGVDNEAGIRTGIQAFKDNDEVSIIAVPGVTDPDVQLSLIAHCENLASRFAVLDIPREARTVQDIINHRNIMDTTYAALYHPWLIVFDPLDKCYIAIPPSGSMAGIYAGSDNSRGVHKAPANEVVHSCIGLDVEFSKGEQDLLNPKGVNLIRTFPGMGIRVWGARTASSDEGRKYINVRRLLIFIEESMKAGTNWVVSESNDEALWERVRRTIEVFLTNLWRNGSLAGTSPGEAFFVNIGRSTMSQDDIDNGRVICVIGVAPVRPAEFVVFKLTQKTGDAQ